MKTNLGSDSLGAIRAGLGRLGLFFLLILAAALLLALAQGREVTSDFLVRVAIVALVVAAFVTALILRHERQPQPGSPQFADWMKQQRRELTGPGWVKRLLLWGGGGGLAIGVPLGSLFAYGASDVSGGFVMVVLKFAIATLAWTVPAMLVIRWLSLRSLRCSDM